MSGAVCLSGSCMKRGEKLAGFGPFNMSHDSKDSFLNAGALEAKPPPCRYGGRMQ